MADFEGIGGLIIKSMQGRNATSESSAKTLKELSKACNRPGSLIANVIDRLVKNGKVNKVAKNGHSYYFLQAAKK